MKYWIPGTFVTMAGLMFVFVSVWLASQQGTVLKVFIFVAFGVGIFAICSGFDSDLRLSHHRKILKKAGLWTDEEIRKKDLKKPNDSTP